MTKKTTSFKDILDLDSLADAIANRFTSYDTDRNEMKTVWTETYESIFQTLHNRPDAWQSKALLPKSAQIYDNLKANISATVIPNERFMEWQTTDREDSTLDQRDTVIAYARAKLDQQEISNVVEKLVSSLLVNGNCFARVKYVNRLKQVDDGVFEQDYSGPEFEVIDPLDIVFDPQANKFEDSWKIIRTVMHIGEISRMVDERPDLPALKDAYERLLKNRTQLANLSRGDQSRLKRDMVDGVNSLAAKLIDQQEHVEVLEFLGDIWDQKEQKLHRDRRIIVWDRQVISMNDFVSHSDHSIFHTVYRARPASLWGQGPFENINGMAYSINTIFNSIIDIINLSVTPVTVSRGEVDLPEDGLAPGDHIHLSGPTDTFDIKTVDSTGVVNAYNSLQSMMRLMEEFAGAPSQNMGIRAPGEKTLGEVQQLEAASARLFRDVAARFELNLLEPMINAAIIMARKFGDELDTIKLVGDDKTVKFKQLTRKDFGKSGRLRVKGARHFQESSQKISSLMNVANLMGMVNGQQHLRSYEFARMLMEMAGVTDYNVLSKHAQIFEQAEAQELAASAQEESLAGIGTDIDTDAIVGADPEGLGF